MCAQIVIECQTQKEPFTCDYCIGKRNLIYRIKIEKYNTAKINATYCSMFES